MTVETEYICGPFRIVPARQELLCDGAPVALGGRAFEVLCALVRRAGELVPKQLLFETVWPATIVEDNNLTVAISAIRRALGCGVDGKRYVATVTGRGYRFVAPVIRKTPAPVSVPASAAPTEPGNLPIALSPPIGRDRDLEIALDLLTRSRLVSLVGAGGVGKTRLALALGHAARPDWPDGVWFVELAALISPELVAEAIAAALGLDVPDRNSAAALAAYFLRKRKALLILDNCEHQLDPTARAVQAILASCPDVTVLTTTREPIKVAGEQAYFVPSLSVPEETEILTAEAALRHGAVRLFVERAAAAADGYRLSDADAPIVAEICRRLDGIALAIELAAARLKMIGARELSARLDDRFHLLTQGSRTALPRHQTLRALIDWSYELLGPDERSLLDRLSVFAGGFTLDAAIAVAGDGFPDWVVFDLVGSLVDKSLVVADVGEHGTRYRLLDSTRRYAAERLRSAGDPGLGRRHAGYFAAFMQEAEAAYETRSFTDWLGTYGADLDNLRTAIDWAFGPGGDPDIGVTVIAYARQLRYELATGAEFRRWLDTALAHVHSGIPPGIAARLRFASGHRPVYGMLSVAADLREGLALARQSGEPVLIARAMSLIAVNDLKPATARAAMATLAEAIKVVRPLGLTRSVSVLTGRLGLAADLAGEKALAKRCYEEAIGLAQSIGSSRSLITLRSNLAELLFDQGEHEAAIAAARGTIGLARQAGLKVNECQTGINLGAYLMVAGRTGEASRSLAGSLALARSLGEDFLAMSAVQHLALALARRGDPRTAARLLGRVDAAYEAESSIRESTEQATFDLLRAELLAALPEAELAELLAEGTALPRDEAFEAAAKAGS